MGVSELVREWNMNYEVKITNDVDGELEGQNQWKAVCPGAAWIPGCLRSSGTNLGQLRI